MLAAWSDPFLAAALRAAVACHHCHQADAFRSEHSSRRHLERQLDALCQQVQRRMAAAAVQAQEHAALLAQQEAAAREVAEAQGHARLLQAQVCCWPAGVQHVLCDLCAAGTPWL